MVFSYLSPTWIRSPSCCRSLAGTRSPEKGLGLHLGASQALLVIVGLLLHVGVLVKVGILVEVGVLVILGVLK